MRVTSLVAVGVLTATGAWTTLAARPVADTTRTIYMSAQDAKGVPVTDLKADELTVKEDSKDRKIESLKPATADMDIALLVDDSGTGAFQAGALQILQAVIEHSKVTIEQFSPQSVKLAENTNDFDKIQDALNKLSMRGKIEHQGRQINDTIAATAREMTQRKSPRPVIVVLTIGGVGPVDNANFTMDQLRDSGAQLYAVYVSNADLGIILGDGPRQSGGVIAHAGAINALPAAYKTVIDALTNQYALTYTLPDGVKPNERVQVTTTRKGITLNAPQRIPAK